MTATLFLCLLATDPKPKAELPPAATVQVNFDKQIASLLTKNCAACHNPTKRKGGLDLTVRTKAIEGGDSGKVIVEKESAKSRLIHVIAGTDAETKMPPEGNLSKEEIGLLRAWIDQGAKYGSVKIAGGAELPKHWAYQPVKIVEPPASKDPWIRNGIDAFVLDRLKKEGLKPSPEADKITLIRRLKLDLLGLPPTKDEVEAFLKDTSPDAYAKLVDQFLASPHYGERWGRHWLDAARYADSDGYEKDTGRPNAWRYRDWVIDALNRDLPFNQFAIEQLAGRLLPNASLQQRMATGFHRNTLTNKEGGVDQEEYRVQAVIDRVNTTGKVFLGATVACCQCHDHKFDPFSQREYYQLFAFFNSDRETDLPAPLPGEEEKVKAKQADFAKKKATLQKAVEDHRKRLPDLQAKWEAKMTAEAKSKFPKNVQDALAVEAGKRDPAQLKALASHYEKTDAQLKKLQQQVTAHQKTAPTMSMAPTLALGADRATYVMIKGDFLRKGAEVKPGTPAVLPAMKADAKPTRLDLAMWIVDPANPLTRRVTVNWVWQKYFGRGLVATAEDFGTRGEAPSHPELLDWLANQFLAKNWSMKDLHRLIVNSMAYRQSSAERADLREKDPLNVLLGKQIRLRLEAEILRDNALAVSGLLTPTVGGPSIRPPQPAGISELTYANSAKWVESTGSERYRRGMYIWFQRTSPYPMLMAFDSPDSNVCTVRRERSNTPLQALTLLNDVVFVEAAQRFGINLAKEAGSDADKLANAFTAVTSRRPTPAEAEKLQGLLEDYRKAETAKLLGKEKTDAKDAGAWILLARTLLNLDEFQTRE